VRSRRYLAATIIVVLVTAVIAAAWPRSAANVAAAAPPTTTTSTSSTTTTTKPKPAHPFEAADAIVPEVLLFHAPGATEPVDSMPNPTIEHVPLAFLVKAHGPTGWLEVQISRRPNEATSWIHASDVQLRGVDNRIVIQREARQLTVYRGLTSEKLFEAPVATGKPATPTPLGDFFVDIVVKVNRPSGAYGPYQLSVAGFSDVLHSFGGGPGQIAIHGTNHPELIGEFASNGCVRMHNDDVTALSDLAPVGTPVEIVA
jgi:lipoprotein-anchoring transpeptidase ErfK/SrfK